MKNILYKIGSLCLILFISSCNKETEYILAVSDDPSSFKVRIDGTMTSFENSLANIYDDQISRKSLQIVASKDDAQAFNISISNFTGVGEYNLTNSLENTSSLTIDLKDPVSTYFAYEGKINITALTATSISGKFEYKSKNYVTNTEKVFSEGTFTVPIPDPSKNPSIPTTPASANLKAKFNGSATNFIAEANLMKVTQPVSSNNMSITGFSDKKLLALLINDYDGVGTYEIKSNSGHMIIYDLDTSVNASDYVAISGKITVVSATSNTIKGTFECTLEKDTDPSVTILIREGTFEMNFKTTNM